MEHADLMPELAVPVVVKTYAQLAAERLDLQCRYDDMCARVDAAEANSIDALLLKTIGAQLPVLIEARISELFESHYAGAIESMVETAVQEALDPDNIDCHRQVEEAIEEALSNVRITFRG